MNRSNATTPTTLIVAGLAGLVLGGSAVILSQRLTMCEPSHVKYVVEWKDDKLKDPNDRQAFEAALGDTHVRFRHNVVVSFTPGVNDATQLGNYNLGSFCITKPGTPSGLHVTQRVGFNSYDEMVAAEQYLVH